MGGLEWLPWLLTIIGWIVVNSQNNYRERRKEGRSASDMAKELTRAAAELGAKYWLQTEQDVGWRIKATLEDLEVELDRFPNFRGGGPLMHAYVQFADSITGGEFETVNRPKSTAGDEKIRSMFMCRNAMLRQIERQFNAYYC